MDNKMASHREFGKQNGVAVDSYREQYSHNYRIHYFIRRFSLVVSHHQEHKYRESCFLDLQNHGEQSYFCRFYGGRSPQSPPLPDPPLP